MARNNSGQFITERQALAEASEVRYGVLFTKGGRWRLDEVNEEGAEFLTRAEANEYGKSNGFNPTVMHHDGGWWWESDDGDTLGEVVAMSHYR